MIEWIGMDLKNGAGNEKHIKAIYYKFGRAQFIPSKHWLHKLACGVQSRTARFVGKMQVPQVKICSASGCCKPSQCKHGKRKLHSNA